MLHSSRFDALEATIKALRNHHKNGDWTAVVKDFDAAKKALDKAASVIAKDGMPRFYLKALIELEKWVEDAWKAKAKLSTLNGKALGALKQNVRKTLTQFKKEVEDYKKVLAPRDR